MISERSRILKFARSIAKVLENFDEKAEFTLDQSGPLRIATYDNIAYNRFVGNSIGLHGISFSLNFLKGVLVNFYAA